MYTNINELNNILNELPEGTVVVYTYGAWDLFHPGHVRFLMRAKELGDFLIVGTVSDKPITNLKGEGRPLQVQEDRMIVVGSLRCVDASIPQEKYDPSNELESLKKVDILTKGDDWEYIPGTEKIKELGGRLIKLSYTSQYSTTNIVSKLNRRREK